MCVNVPMPPPTYKLAKYNFKVSTAFKYLGLHINTNASSTYTIKKTK